MKKRFLPHICLIGIASFIAFTSNATVYFDDNFDAYNDGALYNQGGWVKYGTNTDNPIQLTATNLTYDGYQSGVTGKAVQLQKFTDKDSEDLQKALTTPFNPVNLDSKTFYMSFLVNVQEAGAAPFISLCDANTTFADGSTGIQKMYVFAKESSEGKVKFAVSKNSETANLSETSTEFDLNTTCLVVLKYTANPADIDDDQIDMYVNPVITSEAANSSLCTATEGSDINVTKGLASVQLRQRRTWSIQSPSVIVDAIRIADTWNELFGLEEPPVTDQPTLHVSETNVDFGFLLFVGDQLTQTINIKAEHLTGDITIGGLSGDVVASVTTISKEDAMTEAGVDVTLTLTITQVGEFTQNLTISSEDAATLTIPVTWFANPSVANIEDLLDAYGGDNDYYTYRVEGEVVVTHVYSMNGVLTMIVQDETGAMFIQDAYEMLTETYTVGDRLEKIFGMLTNSLGVYYFNPIMMGTATRNEPVEPQVVTLAELQANPLDYMARLVRVNDIAFASTGAFSTQQVEITQNGTTGKVGLFVDSEIIGETIPAKADIIGISRNATGQLISPRFKTDIIAKVGPTGIDPSKVADNVWTDNGTLYLNLQEDATVHIYNVQGKQVYGGNMVAGLNSLSLEQGIYLIKMNENTTKILIK